MPMIRATPPTSYGLKMIHRKLLYPDEIDLLVKDLASHEVFAIVGHDSVWVPSQQTKYVNRTRTRDWPNVDGEVLPMTPGEAAREELKREFPGVSLRARKRDFVHLDISPPILYTGPHNGDMFYIDLKSAYWQIYQRLALDVCWPRGQGTLMLKPIAARLYEWKTARNSLVGVTRSHQITALKGGRLVWQRMHNPFFNPHLWRHIQEVLHEIAAEAVAHGSIYIATDGYIFTRAKGWWRFRRFLSRHGLHYTEASGFGWVRGWGSYHIEGFKTTKRQNDSVAKIDNLVMPDERRTLKWLVNQAQLTLS